MLCCDGRTSHHVTWFKRLCWQTVQSDHKRVVPKAGLRTTQYLSCTECTGSSRDVKFCRRRPHSWSCTLLGLCTLGCGDSGGNRTTPVCVCVRARACVRACVCMYFLCCVIMIMLLEVLPYLPQCPVNR